MKESIFKEYDIRGVYGKDISPKIMHKVGLAFAKFAKARNAKKVFVGHDTRIGSPEMAKSLVNVLLDSGIDVDFVGLVTGPMLYAMTNKLKYDYGLYVTASHNPKEYNGLKISDKNSIFVYNETGLNTVRKIYEGLKPLKKQKKGKLRKVDISKEYIGELAAKVKGLKHFRIIIDTSNGSTSLYARRIFERLGQRVILLNSKPDGNFPGHEPNPMKDEACIQAVMAVKRHRADLGIIFDGDGDRIRVIDEKGNLLRSDMLFGILAQYELQRKKIGIYFADLRVSKAIEEVIGKRAVFKRMRVGNPFYKKALMQKHAVMAGELSGHIMYKEHYRVDDAIFAAVKLLSCMSRYGKLSNLAKPFQSYFYSGEINFKVKDKDKAIQNVLRKYKSLKISRIDGISAEGKGFWFNVRKSNTEPLIRLIIEAKSQETVRQLKQELSRLLR